MKKDDIEMWFADKYDMGILGQRMHSIEFNANNVCDFIRGYLIDKGIVFPVNEQEEKDEKLQWLIDSDESIHSAYFGETEQENCIIIDIGSSTNQFEICFTETQLIKMLYLTNTN